MNQPPSDATHADLRRLAKLRKQLERDRELFAEVVTGSMAPIIRPGDTIKVVPLPEELKPFDIVVFVQRNLFICHLVIRQRTQASTSGLEVVLTAAYQTQMFDYPVHKKFILGLVVSQHLRWWQKILFVIRFRLRNR